MIDDCVQKVFIFQGVPSTNIAPEKKIDPWKRRFRLENTIFRGHVSFRECEFQSILILFVNPDSLYVFGAGNFLG